MRRASILPMAAAAACCAAVLYVAASDEHTWLPGCAFHTLTGLWCPGCGLTRAARAAMHGDVRAAMSHNVLAPAFALALLVAWWQWWRQVRGRPRLEWVRRLPAWLPAAAASVLVVFAVARNVPVAPFDSLAP